MNTGNLFTLTVMILLPIIPALVLFKALPSTANMEGPLGSQKVKFGGAFAGYFGVLLAIFMFRNDWAPAPPQSAYQVWQVSGAIVDGNGAPLEALQQGQFQVAPAVFVNRGAGRFEVTVVTTPGPTGNARFPSLSIAYPPYAEMPVDLESDAVGQGGVRVTRDAANHLIRIVDPIRLKKLDQYVGSGTPPVPVPAGE